MWSDVSVDISTFVPTGSPGFGHPLILASKATAAVPYTECRQPEDVIAAGFNNETDVYKAANLIFMQDDRPEKIAVCAVTGSAVEGLGELKARPWRQLLVVLGDDDSTPADVSAHIETTDNRVAFFTFESAETIAVAPGANRSVAFVYPGNKLAAAAVIGASAGIPAGGLTYKNLILKGLDPVQNADVDAIHTAGGFTLLEKAGDIVTSEGKTPGGEFIDIVDSRDYLISEMVYRTQRVLNLNRKIPYTNSGIAQLEGVAVDVLRGAYVNGMIADSESGGPAYTVDYAPRSQTTTEDRAARKYVGGRFSFELAGAIHTVAISGELVI